MKTNLEKYKKDLDRLLSKGLGLYHFIMYEYKPELYKSWDQKTLQQLPDFHMEYQIWYSESLAIIKLLLSNRTDDFITLYKKSQNRKNITSENYTIEDYLLGLEIIRGASREVGPESAIPNFIQQLAILRSAKQRFKSSLFDIKQLLQADLFDSELSCAKELNKKGFIRGAGAIAGTVLESHLRQICENHKIKPTFKNPTINKLNELLKKKEVIDVSQFRKIQYLGDLRNLCTHDKKNQPTKEKVTDLIDGTESIIKIIF